MQGFSYKKIKKTLSIPYLRDAKGFHDIRLSVSVKSIVAQGYLLKSYFGQQMPCTVFLTLFPRAL